MKGVDAVANILKREGVEYLFCFPNNSLIDACAKIGIRPILARTERTLINMADGYSRTTHGERLGVAVVQAGPGSENAFGGVAQAYADSVLLNNSALGGYEKLMPVATERYRLKFLSGNYAKVAQGLGGYSERVEKPADIIPAIQRAQEQIAAGRPALLEMITREEGAFSMLG